MAKLIIMLNSTNVVMATKLSVVGILLVKWRPEKRLSIRNYGRRKEGQKKYMIVIRKKRPYNNYMGKKSLSYYFLFGCASRPIDLSIYGNASLIGYQTHLLLLLISIGRFHFLDKTHTE